MPVWLGILCKPRNSGVGNRRREGVEEQLGEAQGSRVPLMAVMPQSLITLKQH